MDDGLLHAYARELDALRGLAGDFAQAHPKIAGRLRLTNDRVDDPHVERLLEGVAFLSARAQRRLDDELPEITDALLGVLYPHYLAPVPSAAIVQLTCKPDLRVPLTLRAGILLETEVVGEEPVRFRSTCDTILWPISVESVRLTGLPLMAPVHPAAHGAQSSLRVTLTLTDPDAAFSDFEVAALRFFLNGPLEQTLPLYELLGAHVVGVALADGPNDARPTALPPTAIRLGGFGADEALYPWSARSFSGFRLLTEYFALPEKFLFVEIAGLDARTIMQASGRLEIFVYFDCDATTLERRLKPDCMALGCTPAVNLFPRRCEAVPLDATRTEYPIVADYRRPGALEVWGIERVSEIVPDGSSKSWRPFYGRVAAVSGYEQPAGFYNVIRRDNSGTLGGSDVFLAPFDPSPAVEQPVDRVLSVEALCTNRDLPQRLPFGGGQPRLFAVDGLSSVTGIACLTAPTPTLRAPLRERRGLRLISHLSLGHLSVVGGAEAAAALREVLILHDLRDTAESRAAIAALLEVHAVEATARVPGARLGSFCRGLEVTLVFEPAAWIGGGLFLLASVIERFLALHATVNSFVRTRVTLRGHAGDVAQFPPRAGAQVLL